MTSLTRGGDPPGSARWPSRRCACGRCRLSWSEHCDARPRRHRGRSLAHHADGRMGRAVPRSEQRQKGDRRPGEHTGKPRTARQCAHRRTHRWKGVAPGNGTHGGSPSDVKGDARPWRGTGVPRLGCPAGKARRFVAHRCVRGLQRSAFERTGPGQMRASGQASDRDQAGLVSVGRVTTRRSLSTPAVNCTFLADETCTVRPPG